MVLGVFVVEKAVGAHNQGYNNSNYNNHGVLAIIIIFVIIIRDHQLYINNNTFQ